ncbi:hypothetical protein [Nocardiopsis synnemataformans]|uniref:hypothetical protein n=1 Tax=Nocardiopsis synnemataformans TaxID=61305 RepID=UPI003EBB843B
MVVSMDLAMVRADHVVAGLPEVAWQRLSCGDGAHGSREYRSGLLDGFINETGLTVQLL